MISKSFTSLGTMKFKRRCFFLQRFGLVRWLPVGPSGYTTIPVPHGLITIFSSMIRKVFFLQTPRQPRPILPPLTVEREIPGTSQPTIELNASFGTLVISPDRKRLDLYFATPLAPDSFFDLHCPIEGLANFSGFGFAQTPIRSRAGHDDRLGSAGHGRRRLRPVAASPVGLNSLTSNPKAKPRATHFGWPFFVASIKVAPFPRSETAILPH